MKRSILIILLLSFFPLFSENIRVSDLKFYIEAKGSFHGLSNGDLGDFIDYAPDGYHKKRGNYSFEVGLSFGRLAIGLEAGFFNREFSTDQPFGVNDEPVKDFMSSTTFKNTFIMLNNRFRIVDLKKIKIDGKLGVGVFIGKFDFSETVNYVDEEMPPRINSIDAKKGAPGFQLGISGEFNINSWISVVSDLQYRLVNLTDIEGNMTYRGKDGEVEYTKGDIWYLTEKASGRKMFWVGPGNTNFFEGDKASFKINGLLLNIGLRIYL